MSIKQVSSVLLTCDGGCSATVEGERATDARAKAKEVGWEFPATLRSNGTPAKRTSDVCPVCAPEFSRKIGAASTHWAYMTEEERRLRTMLRTSWRLLSEQEQQRLTRKLADMEAARSAS